MAYLLAHDLGTSGDKAVLYGTDGTIVAETTVPYPTAYPFDKAAEQNPEDWWSAFCAATRSLLGQPGVSAREVLAVSFSAQMNSCLPYGRDGRALRPAMIWADQRADAEAARIAGEVGLRRVYERTGQRLSAALGVAKMAWFKAHEPELYRQTACFLQPKDTLVFRLTGRMRSDYSDASHLGCFDLETMGWSDEILESAGLSPAKMPELLPSFANAGTVTREASEACGLLQGTPVIMGGGDGACATAGAAIHEPGQAYAALGTSGWIATLGDTPYSDPEERTFTLMHLDGRRYIALGAVQMAGQALNWAAGALYSEMKPADFYKQLPEMVREVPAGSGGLLFLPYLLGERSPWWNPDASGCFIGLTARQGRNDMLRAVMEGVGLNLRLILDVLSAGRPIREMSLLGGVTRNPAFAQLLSDVWQRELRLVAMPEYATSAGAALCAGIGAGVYKGFGDAAGLNPVRETVKPRAENRETYQRALERFTALYHALKPVAFSGDPQG